MYKFVLSINTHYLFLNEFYSLVPLIVSQFLKTPAMDFKGPSAIARLINIFK